MSLIDTGQLNKKDISNLIDRAEYFKKISLKKEGRELLVTPFVKDDHVKIIAGPFIDFSGVVEELNEGKKLQGLEMGILYTKIPEAIKKEVIEIEAVRR